MPPNQYLAVDAFERPRNEFLGEFLAAYTAQHRHIGYRMGARSTTEGFIDCSGWAAELVLAAMTHVNDACDRTVYDFDAVGPLMKAAAAAQIQRVSDKIGLIDQAAILAGDLPSGTLIGIRRQTGGDWAAARWNRISHIVIVMRDVGDLQISQSASGRGVYAMPYSEWLKHEVGLQSVLYAADPFRLTADKAMLTPQAAVHAAAINPERLNVPGQHPVPDDYRLMAATMGERTELARIGREAVTGPKYQPQTLDSAKFCC